MGRSLQLLIEESGGKSSPHVAKQPPTNLKMKFFAILCCGGFTQAFLVRREADADPEADADAGYGYNVANVGGSISAPVCNPVSVPVKTCAPRQIEKPRQVCHEECDTIVDTTITENCETVTTTRCTQEKVAATRTSGVVGHDSKVVATGVIASPERTVAHGVATGVVAGYGAVGAGYGAVGAIGHGAIGHGAVGAVGAVGAIGYGGVTHAGYGKREADAEADAYADADAAYGTHGYAVASPVAVSPPVCNSVPVTQCNKVPVDTPRKVCKTVCKTIVDITTIEDCKETITTTTECRQTKVDVQTRHSSGVVGHDTKVGPSAVVATHGSAAVVAAAPAVAVAGYAGGAIAGGAIAGGAIAGAPVVAGYAGTGLGLAGYAGH